jgi:hypothetical protein
MRVFIFSIILLLSPAVQALELFGVTVDNINRVQLREALGKVGAVIIREAGDDNWFDIYDVSAGFNPSKTLFVGYDKTSGNFAFAEYQLPFNYFTAMLQQMKFKYGKPVTKYGQYESDKRYIWQIGAIKVELLQDWHKNISRLVYTQEDNLQLLQSAYQQEQQQKFKVKMAVNNLYY